MKCQLFLACFSIIILASSCQKNKDAELPADATCTNITQTINDTLISLVTVETGTSVYIGKIQNGITTTIATQTGFEFWGPSISPDKKKFICFRSPTGNTEKYNDYTAAELWLFNIDGSNGHSIASLSSQMLHAMGMGKWAPDGFHIVFAGEKNETDGNLHWNIYLTDTLGSAGIKMNTRLGSFKYPVFANGDMTKLAYEAWNVGIINAGSVFDTEVHLANVNGSFQFSTEQKITSNEDFEYSPSFSPDNSTLVYCQNTSLAAKTAIELYSSNLTTLTATKVLGNNSINEYPVWCSTNNMIYFLDNGNGNCFEHVNRINPSGTGNATVYQQMNAQLRNVDIK